MRAWLKVFFWPLSQLYGLVVRFRNHLYNIGYKKSFSFQTNVISVGNLGVGGNGKTPMVEYLVRLLGGNGKVAVLSRGYGRTTSGFLMANADSTASEIGDEPLQMFMKFKPQLTVAVGEARAEAIPKILFENPEIQTIILDDAFQHRAVQPQFSILVTDYWTPFFSDFMLPAGRLREPRKEVRRADLVVVTKCPPGLSEEERQRYSRRIRSYHPAVPVFFASITYKQPIHFFKVEESIKSKSVILLSGIAKAETLRDYVKKEFNLIEHLRFRDHYRYNKKDIELIREKLRDRDDIIILTTEKDMVRLIELGEDIIDLPLYYLPIECSFIDGEEDFISSISNSLTSYHHT